jgi:hypothetical protein
MADMDDVAREMQNPHLHVGSNATRAGSVAQTDATELATRPSTPAPASTHVDVLSCCVFLGKCTGFARREVECGPRRDPRAKRRCTSIFGKSPSAMHSALEIVERMRNSRTNTARLLVRRSDHPRAKSFWPWLSPSKDKAAHWCSTMKLASALLPHAGTAAERPAALPSAAATHFFLDGTLSPSALPDF